MAEYDDFGAHVNPEFLGDQTINPIAEYLAKFWRKITPTQRIPGGLLNPLNPRAPINPAELADPTIGGALPPVRRRPVARQPIGAIPQNIQPQVVTGPTDVQESDVATPVVEQPAAVAAPAIPVVPAAPQKGLREQFMERLAGMNKGQSTGMTQEQKGQALMEAGLAIMAAASKPGASAMGAVGQGGMQGMVVAREMERLNRERADKIRAEDRANLGTEFTLAGQDIERADRKADKAEGHTVRREEIARQEKRDIATEAYQNRHLDILRDQFRSGQKKAVEDSATGTYTILDLAGGPPIKTDVKFDRKDSRPAEIQLLDGLIGNPKRMEVYKEIKGEKGGISEKDIITQAVELTKSQAMGSSEPMEAILQRNIDAVRRAVGKPAVSGGPAKTISRKSKTYQDRLKTRAGGDSKRFDAELQAAGYTVTD